MPRVTDVLKEKILADYHTNKYSQRALAKKYAVSLGTISKLTKNVNPKNEHFVDAQTTILKGYDSLSDTEMNAIMNTSNDMARREGLVFGATEKALKKAYDLVDTADNGAEIKSIIEGIDRASLTLGVNRRHANSQVQINNTNAQQDNNVLTIEDFYKDNEKK